MSFKIYKNGNWIECAGQPDISGFVPRTTTTTPASELQDKTIMYDGADSGIWKRGHIYHYQNYHYWEVSCTDSIMGTTTTFYSKTALSPTVKSLLYTDINCTQVSAYSATTTTLYDSTGILEFGVVNSSTEITTYYQWQDITDIPNLTNYVTTNSQQSISQMKTWEPNSESQYSLEVSDTGITANKYSLLAEDIRGIIDSSAKLVSDGILFTYNAYQNKKLSFPQNKTGTFVLDTDLTSYYTKTQCDNTFATQTALQQGLATREAVGTCYTKTQSDNTFLKLSGGTMTGELKMGGYAINNAPLIASANDSDMTMRAGYTNWQVPRLDLKISNGTFELQAGNTSTSAQLVGKASDKSLKWDSKDVMTSNYGLATPTPVSTYITNNLSRYTRIGKFVILSVNVKTTAVAIPSETIISSGLPVPADGFSTYFTCYIDDETIGVYITGSGQLKCNTGNSRTTQRWIRGTIVYPASA